jgi:hypothetical protein
MQETQGRIERLSSGARALLRRGRSAIKRRPIPEVKHRVFVSSGGMGSSYLVNAIRGVGVPCVEKPLVSTFFTEDYPTAARKEHDRPTVPDLDALPTPEICRRFLAVQDELSNAPERFSLRPKLSLATNILLYLEFLRSTGCACLLRGTSVQGLLVRAEIRNQVFMIRDPIQSYLSYGKPDRHKHVFDALGGAESEGAIAFWCWTWNTLATEYLDALAAGLDPVLIRYEDAVRDGRKTGDPFLTQVFSSFTPRMNEITISERCAAEIRKGVSEKFEQLFGAVAG